MNYQRQIHTFSRNFKTMIKRKILNVEEPEKITSSANTNKLLWFLFLF